MPRCYSECSFNKIVGVAGLSASSRWHVLVVVLCGADRAPVRNAPAAAPTCQLAASPPPVSPRLSPPSMAHCGSSAPNAKVQTPRPDSIMPSSGSVDQSMKPVLFEIFGEIWTVQSRLGQGVSASVYRVSSGRAATAAVKEFQADTQGGDYGYHKERSVLEDIQGHKNIGRDLFVIPKTFGRVYESECSQAASQWS